MAEKRAWVPPIEEAPNGETGLAKRRGGAADESGNGDCSMLPVNDANAERLNMERCLFESEGCLGEQSV